MDGSAEGGLYGALYVQVTCHLWSKQFLSRFRGPLCSTSEWSCSLLAIQQAAAWLIHLQLIACGSVTMCRRHIHEACMCFSCSASHEHFALAEKCCCCISMLPALTGGKPLAVGGAIPGLSLQWQPKPCQSGSLMAKMHCHVCQASSEQPSKDCAMTDEQHLELPGRYASPSECFSIRSGHSAGTCVVLLEAPLAPVVLSIWTGAGGPLQALSEIAPVLLMACRPDHHEVLL